MVLTIWVRSWNCSCLVTWFCYQLITKPGNKTATVPWPYSYKCLLCYIDTHPPKPVHSGPLIGCWLRLFSWIPPKSLCLSRSVLTSCCYWSVNVSLEEMWLSQIVVQIGARDEDNKSFMLNCLVVFVLFGFKCEFFPFEYLDVRQRPLNILPHLTSPHTSPHLTSPHLTSLTYSLSHTHSLTPLSSVVFYLPPHAKMSWSAASPSNIAWDMEFLVINRHAFQRPLLLTWINFIPSIKLIHVSIRGLS